MVAGSMTDPKGDRSLPPSKQADTDLYVHIIEKNDQGIVISGAKAHQTGIVNSHEMLVMPTTALSEDDKSYAVACPATEHRVAYRRQPRRTESLAKLIRECSV